MCSGDERQPFIAYAVQQFPALRTTFIRREVEALRALGLPIEVVSMRPANRLELENEEEARRHLDTTHYLPSRPFDGRSGLDNLAAAVHCPRETVRNLGLLCQDPGAPGVARRLRVALQVWRGAVTAAQLKQIGRCRHIHAHFADGAATTALCAARLLGVPFSFTSHTSFDSPALRTKLREAAFVASISEYDRGRLIAAGGPKIADKIHVIHCGIPLEDWPLRPYRPPGSPLRILSVGALIEKKGHDDLVRACALLRQRGVVFHCKIIGGGPLKAQLQASIRDLGLDDTVCLAGPMPQEAVREELYAADLFVLACKQASNGDTDGVPVSLMEAMAAGVPVVSCRIAGVPELLDDGRCGWLAEPGSASSLADQICSAIGAERESISVAARRRIEDRFDQAKEANRLAQLFPGGLYYGGQRAAASCQSDRNGHPGHLTVGIGSRGYGYRRVAYDLPLSEVHYRKVPYAPWKLVRRTPPWQNTYLFAPWPRVDLFHLWNGISLNAAPWITSFEAHLPRYSISADRYLYRVAIERIHSPSCRRLLALSEFAKRFFFWQNAGRLDAQVLGKTEVFYGSVPIQERHLEQRRNRPAGNDEFLLCFVGHDFFQKGGVPSVRAFQALRKTIPGLRLVVVSRLRAGDFVTSASEAESQAMRKTLTSTPGIEWHEQLPHEELLSLMAKADLGLLPSLDDTFGWSVVEFMSVGLPVVVSNVCALPEIVEDGVNGFRVPLPLQENCRWAGLRNPGGSRERRTAVEDAWEQLTRGIVACVERVVADRMRLAQMSEAAVEHVRQFHDPATQAARLRQIYEDSL